MSRGIFGRCKHDWCCLRTVQGTERTLTSGGPYSIIHWKCLDCTKIKAKTITGHWEPEDFD